MKQIISEELVQERIDKYIEDNKDEIIELIDKKIEVKVKESIRGVFAHQHSWTNTPAAEVIDNRIKTEIKLQAENIEIDTDWIKEQVTKKVKSAVKNIRVVTD